MSSPDGARPVRSYVVTGGRTEPARSLTMTTLLYAAHGGEMPESASPQERALLRLCGRGQLTLAEAAAHLCLPVTLAAVLASDLIGTGYLACREQRRDVPDLGVLEEVLHGLRRLA